jgi:hypothetical protein
VLHPGRILCFEQETCDPGALLRWALALGAGMAGLVGRTSVQPTGPGALREARALKLLGETPGADQSEGAPDPVEIGCALFQKWFPHGIVWVPGTPAQRLGGLTPGQTRNLFADAFAYLRDLHPNGRRSGVEVTALSEGDKLKCIFGLPRHLDLRARDRWRSVIRNLNLTSSSCP